MSRDEITRLLEFVISAYPNTKIKDASMMVSAWEMGLGDLSAEAVYKSARLHMLTSAYFPTIFDIRKNIQRAEILFSFEQNNRMIEGSGENKELPSGTDFDDFLL